MTQVPVRRHRPSTFDTSFVVFVAALVALFAGLVGWQVGVGNRPAPIETRIIEKVTPPACLRALEVADTELGLAVKLSTQMSRVAPLVDDAYQAGINGNLDPAVIDRVKDLNKRVDAVWEKLGTLPNRRAEIADKCEDA